MDAEARKIIGNVWASADAADRENPEDLGISRRVGWPVSYEQVGTGDEPERTIFNQRFREWDGIFELKMRMGGVMPWNEGINYFQWARAIGSDGQKYMALRATGPAHGNAIAPTEDERETVWRLY